MSEFVGRTGSNRVYSYPETPRGINPLVAFARNFATGPKTNTAIGTGISVPWNAIDALSTSSAFTVAAGGTTVSIQGDATGLFTNGDRLIITPTAPAPLPPVNTLSVASVPVFAAGVTTFNLSGPIDGSTTAGTIDDQANVPITPRATGEVLVSGVVTVVNDGVAPVLVTVTVHVDGVAVSSPFAATTVPSGGSEVAIPFLAETEIISPLNETHVIQIFVDGNGSSLLSDGAVVNVQEVAIATG